MSNTEKILKRFSKKSLLLYLKRRDEDWERAKQNNPDSHSCFKDGIISQIRWTIDVIHRLK